jgi:hypothetical protein
MAEVYYKKVGRKYVPTSYYDTEVMDSFPAGTHVVMVYPGGKSTRYHVNPDTVALLAAARVAEDAISTAIMKATEIRRQQRHDKETPLTPSQREAWNNLVKEFGDTAKQLEWPSARECAEAGAKALIEEAEKLLTVPSVKLAYDHFMLVSELTKDENDK